MGDILGAMDKLINVTFSALLTKKFTDWNAFKLGLIDAKGNKLKDPKTDDEKKSLTTIINLVRKIKRILVKFTGDSQTINFIISMMLLKENEDKNECMVEIENDLNDVEIKYFKNYMEYVKCQNL